MPPKTVIGLKARLPDASDREGLERIAKASKVPYHTLLKIANGQTEDPRISTVEKLQRYLEEAA